MSLFASFLKPALERELVSLEPEMSQFVLTLVKTFAVEILEWAEEKLNMDLNQDGKIGDKQ